MNFGFICHEIREDFDTIFDLGAEGNIGTSILPRRKDKNRPKDLEYQANKTKFQVTKALRQGYLLAGVELYLSASTRFKKFDNLGRIFLKKDKMAVDADLSIPLGGVCSEVAAPPKNQLDIVLTVAKDYGFANDEEVIAWQKAACTSPIDFLADEAYKRFFATRFITLLDVPLVVDFSERVLRQIAEDIISLRIAELKALDARPRILEEQHSQALVPCADLPRKTDIGLCLSHKDLEGIPEEVYSQPRLRTLSLSHNKIASLPKDMDRFSELVRLDISHNEIREFPVEVSSLTRLRYLTLAHNKIVFISKEVNKVVSLIWLDLSYNQLREFSEELCSLESLEDLSLAHNGIVTISEKISRLSKLIRLNLCGNRINQIPEDFAKLKDLKFLDIRKNLLLSVPYFFSDMRSLVRANFRENPINTVLGRNSAIVVSDSLGIRARLLKIPSDDPIHRCGRDIEKHRGRLEGLEKSLRHFSLELSQIKNAVGLTSDFGVKNIIYCDRYLALCSKDKSEISLRYRNILIIPPQIVYFQDVARIDVSGNLLETLPKEIASLATLKSLKFFNNPIRSLPNEIYMMHLKLWNLYVRATAVGIPETDPIFSYLEKDLFLAQEKNLERKIMGLERSLLVLVSKIEGGDDFLKTLPRQSAERSFAARLWLKERDLDKIEILDLSGMELTVLPEDLIHFRNLKELRLSHNSFIEVPYLINRLENLEILDMSFNESLHGTEFTLPISIIEVDFSHCSFEEFPPYLLVLPKLSRLVISYNFIGSFPKELTNENTRLTYLDVSKNATTWVETTNPKLRLISDDKMTIRARILGLIEGDEFADPPLVEKIKDYTNKLEVICRSLSEGESFLGKLKVTEEPDRTLRIMEFITSQESEIPKILHTFSEDFFPPSLFKLLQDIIEPKLSLDPFDDDDLGDGDQGEDPFTQIFKKSE